MVFLIIEGRTVAYNYLHPLHLNLVRYNGPIGNHTPSPYIFTPYSYDYKAQEPHTKHLEIIREYQA